MRHIRGILALCLSGFILTGFNWGPPKFGKFSFAKKEESQAPSVSSAPAAKKPAAYRTYSSPEHRFSMKIPVTWFEGVKTSSSIALLYLANRENDPISNINVQVIPVTLIDPSLKDQAINMVAQQLIDQIMNSPESKIEQDRWVEVATHRGRELKFQYRYKQKILKQRQFISFHKNNVYAFIYTAEVNAYQKFLSTYIDGIQSLQFFEGESVLD